MDAVKFIEERNRMCRFYGDWCTGCPARNASGASACLVAIELQGNAEEQVQIVEEWSAAHPRKTRQSVFLEQYPNAKVNAKGIVEIWPCDVEKNMQTAGQCNSIYCVDCSREFWMQDVE